MTVASVARRAREEIAPLAALFAAALSIWAFVAVAEEVWEGETHAFDLAILKWLRPHADPQQPLGPAWLNTAAQEMTALGGVTTLALLGLMALGFLLIRRQRLEALMLTLALSGGLLISESLKSLFERDRPPELYRIGEAINASFPSGHALLSTVSYLTLGALLTRTTRRRALRGYLLGCGLLLALLVGISRIYLGMHWTTDVLAGWSLGAAWAALCWLAAYALQRRRGGVTPAEGEAPATAAAPAR